MDMSMVYTCQLLKCVIECPCQVCKLSRNVCCKSRHSLDCCDSCNPQCRTHSLWVPYMFEPATDQYTMVTDRMKEYRFAYGYAGIPSSCKQCSVDVLEHQVLHLVSHQLCRFCRFESRPLEQFRGSKRLKRFKNAEQKLNSRDNKTCSICLKVFKDKYARQLHEKIVHLNEVQKFKCDQCPKSYVCQSSLDYHVQAKHEKQQVEKPTCEECGKHFSSSTSLARHNVMFHTSEGSSKFLCHCGKKFALLANMKRHKREKHLNIKVNKDFEEGPRNIYSHECDQCDQIFKRRYHLSRHVRNAHTDNKLSCTFCDQKFARQDSLRRHVKNKHVSMEK